MADPTGGMFEARLGLKDDVSEPIEGIQKNIEKAVGGTKKLDKGLKGMSSRLDSMYKQTKKIVAGTNKIGMVGAALLGIKGKGGLEKQTSFLKDMLGDIGKMIKGALVDSMFTLGDAALYAAEKAAVLASVVSGFGFLAYFPKILAGSLIEAAQLVTVIEELRYAQILANDAAADLGDQMATTMLNTSANLEKVMGLYNELAGLGQLGTDGVEELADATAYMSEAWRMGTGELLEFNRQIQDLYQAKGRLEGIASAMDYVSRTTAASRQELMGLVNSLQNDLILRIPKEMRTRVMPKLIADISAIAGEWKNMFGNPAELMQGVRQIMDPFNEEGQKLRASIVGFGGATADAMRQMADEGDIAGMVIAQTKAVQNLKAQLGDDAFTKTASVYANLLGLQADEYLRMGEASVEAMEARSKAAREELKTTEALRDSWDKAKGIFNEVWNSLENIGKAILISIGTPLLDILVPVVDAIGKGLQKIVEFFKNISDTTKGVTRLIVTVMSFVAAVVSLQAVWGMLTTVLSVVVAVATAIAGAIGTTVVAAVAALAVLAAKFIAIGAAIVAVGYLVYELGNAFYEGLAPALEGIWDLFKLVGHYIVMMFMPVIYALVAYWDDFAAAMEPGLASLSYVVTMLKDTFRELGKQIGEAFGDAGGATTDFTALLQWALKKLAKILGYVATAVMFVLTGFLALFAFLVKLFTPAITLLIGMFTTLWNIVGGFVGVIWNAFAAVLHFFKVIDSPGHGNKLLDSLRQVAFGILSIFTNVIDTITSLINNFIEGVNHIPGIDINPIPSMTEKTAKWIGLKEGGITTRDNVKANLHANEAVIPLEKFPELMQQTVNVNQDAVVQELQYHRRVLERIARSDGMFNMANGG